MAIEYYESIEDHRYIGYQERQNELLSKPDIIKKMNEYSKPHKLKRRISITDYNYINNKTYNVIIHFLPI